MSLPERADDVLSAEAIRAAFNDLAHQLGDAATLTFHADKRSETLTLTPRNPKAVAVCFDYDTGPEGAGEVRFDIAGADEPVYELEYMLQLTEAAITGRVLVVEDWLRREVLITDSSGKQASHQVTGIVGALLFGRNWRKQARTTAFEPYKAPVS